jgi:hypothetical protein
VGPRPFVSPPSLLLVIEPFAWLPFWPAFVAWSAISAGAFLLVCRRLAGWPALALAALAPAPVFALISGQVTLVVAALLCGAVFLTGKRPVIAGLLFACAAMVKPQAALMVPVALLAAGQWRTLGAAAAAGVVGLALCVAVQGSGAWLAWPGAVAEFSKLIDGGGLLAKGISPNSFAHALGLPIAAPLFIAAGALTGIGCTWQVFRRTEDPALRSGALACGALLATPYAMPYEAAALIPAASVLLGRAGTSTPIRIGALLAICFPFQPLAILAFAGSLFAGVRPSSSPAPSSWPEPSPSALPSGPSWRARPWRLARR